jgi:hypothetical protein
MGEWLIAKFYLFGIVFQNWMWFIPAGVALYLIVLVLWRHRASRRRLPDLTTGRIDPPRRTTLAD